jgi:hypothetical protein
MERKVKLEGGTLHTVMALEIKRVLKEEVKDDGVYGLERAAKVLGITLRTLYKYIGPTDKGGWPELQVNMEDAMAKLSTATKAPKAKKSPKKKPISKKK